MRPIIWALVLPLVWFLAGFRAIAAESETEREISQTFANFYMAEKQFNSARDVLIDHLRADREDPRAWNMVGLLWLQRLDYSQAERAFERAVAYSPKSDRSKAVFLYNLADARVRAGQLSQAGEALDGVLALAPELADVVKEARAVMKKGEALPVLSLDHQPVLSQWGASLTLSSGYDSNVLLFSSDILASAERSDTASPFVTVGVGLSYFRQSPKAISYARLVSGYTYETNTAAQAFNFLSNQLSFSSTQSRGSGKAILFGLENTASLTYLNDSGFNLFNWSERIDARLIWVQGKSSEMIFSVPGSYQRYPQESTDSPDDDRSGWGFGGEMSQKFQFGSVMLSFAAEYFRQLAEGSNFRSTTWAAPVSLAWQISQKSSLAWELELSRILYPDSSTNRRDTHGYGALSFYRKLNPRFLASLQYAYRQNNSNDESAKYIKHSGTLAGTYEF